MVVTVGDSFVTKKNVRFVQFMQLFYDGHANELMIFDRSLPMIVERN